MNDIAVVLMVIRSRHFYTTTYKETRTAAVYNSKW